MAGDVENLRLTVKADCGEIVVLLAELTRLIQRQRVSPVFCDRLVDLLHRLCRLAFLAVDSVTQRNGLLVRLPAPKALHELVALARAGRLDLDAIEAIDARLPRPCEEVRRARNPGDAA